MFLSKAILSKSKNMDNGIYITLSRELALFRDMDVTANNIANSNTTGYGAEHMLFNNYLTKDVNQKVRNNMAFANDISTYHSFDGGSLHTTGNSLDLAIQGEGFFSVETPLGTRYTRAGNFQIDGAGNLVTADGKPVLNDSGQHITFPADASNIVVGAAGNISVNGSEFSKIGIYKFDNPQLLERLDGAMFKSEITPQVAENARVAQGTLESSNVQPITELTHMMDVSRSVGDTAKFIETMYDLQRKAASAYAQQGQ
jgi:flagellar basal-body rod protein FlgF